MHIKNLPWIDAKEQLFTSSLGVVAQR